MKIEEETFDLITTATELGIDRDELLCLVLGVDKPLGRLPFIPDSGNPYWIQFSWKQIQFIKRKLKGYKPEPLDYEAIDRVFERILK